MLQGVKHHQALFAGMATRNHIYYVQGTSHLQQMLGTAGGNF